MSKLAWRRVASSVHRVGWVLTSVCALSVAACSGSKEIDLNGQIEALLAANSQSLDLGTLDGSEWNKVCVLPPYTTNEGTQKMIGFKWNSESKTNVLYDDHIGILLFVKDQRVLSFASVSKAILNIEYEEKPCYERDRAKFRAKRINGIAAYVHDAEE